MDQSEESLVPIMKRADQRSTIHIAVFGDDGVGKSSLISSYISGVFSEAVPRMLTRVQLPTAATTTSTATNITSSSRSSTVMTTPTTTIIDTQKADDDLYQMVTSRNINNPLLPPAPSSTEENQDSKNHYYNIDAVILVYDTNREETFQRLEYRWLPLIEKCYDGKVPVIVVENKIDLIITSSESSTIGTTTPVASNTRKIQIVSLMRRYPFIRRCVKCSAKESIERLHDLFAEAQNMVLYPLLPLYNLEMGMISTELEKALLRIFRIYDTNYDHLLSDDDIHYFQYKTFPSYAIFEKDLTNWKKVISRKYNTALETYQRMMELMKAATTTRQQQQQPSLLPPCPEPVLRDGKFTIHGFYAIFDVFISQERFDVVWHTLRQYGYDDDLNLYIPPSIRYINHEEETLGSLALLSNWRLSSSCKSFLTKLFHQFDSDHDGILSRDDIKQIFEVLSPPYSGLPPWHPARSLYLFHKCFSKWKRTSFSSSSSSPPPSSIDEGGPQESSMDHNVDNRTNLSDSTLIIPEAPVTTAAAATTTTQTVISHSGLSILSASDSLPSIDVGLSETFNLRLNYLEWMNYWYVMALISPSITRSELFRLGHSEDYNVSQHMKRKTKRKGGGSSRRYKVTTSQPTTDSFPFMTTEIGTKATLLAESVVTTTTKKLVDTPPLSSYKSREVRVLVLGSRSCGKTALLNVLCGSNANVDGKITGIITTTEDAVHRTAADAIAESSASQSSSGNNTPVSYHHAATDTTPTSSPETCGTFISMKRKSSASASSAGFLFGQSSSKYSKMDGKEFIVHIIFTEVPESYATGHQSNELSDYINGSNDTSSNVFDLVMLVFDCSDLNSFLFVQELEAKLIKSETTPRLFVGTKADQVFVTKKILSSELDRDNDDNDVVVAGNDDQPIIHNIDYSQAVDAATLHCQESDLEQPLLTSSSDVTKHREINSSSGCSVSSSSTSMNDYVYIGTDDTLRMLDHISRCALTNEPNIEKMKSRPHEEQRKRKEAEQRRRAMMWFGGIVTVGVAVAVSVSLLWRSSSSSSSSSSNNNNKNNNRNSTHAMTISSTKDTVSGGLDWLRRWFLR